MLAVGVCLSVAALTRVWLPGDQSVAAELQPASRSARQRDGGSVLVKALRRDMEAVQSGVLVSPTWDDYVLDSPYELRSIVASAFARYPYPESFFATRQSAAPAELRVFQPRRPDSEMEHGAASTGKVSRDLRLGRRYRAGDSVSVLRGCATGPTVFDL